jgi:serine phosphatase RsbU (regulator of sigma subunit)/anti-sigma regulatory factor (Ser/Thr protein kinase)/Flp pilus assembly protein TadD
LLRKVEKTQLKVPAHIDYLGDLRDFVTKVGKRHNFSPKIINAFKLAVDEASTNIIRHAYRDQDGQIAIRALVKKDSLTISLIDQGVFFDPQRVKDPDLNRYIDIGKKGGLGIFIMRKLMDEIDYRKTEEGNELRITKYREEALEKTTTVSKTVPGMPSPIKAKFFFRTIALITTLVAAGYAYFYIKADDEVLNELVSSRSILNAQIVNRLNSALTEGTYIPDVGRTIFNDHINQIYRLSIEDTTGLIEYSSNLDDELTRFRRPPGASAITEGVYKYATDDGEMIYEFERAINMKDTGEPYGKAHIYVSSSSTDAAISATRARSIKLALTVWGATIVGVALLIYLVMSPLQKLSEWIKDLGHGEIHDEIDIDASSEIGEIAQAFSDITYKFRESQRHLADQERLQKEMQVAQDIQQTLLPMEVPDVECYEIASYYEAAKEVGGDYYDFVEVDKDTLGIVVADVSGKGVPGSLVMTMIRTALRTEARGLKDAAEVLARVNEFVSNDIKKGMFVTIFYLIVDSKRRRINYASAGHNPMILYRGSTEKTYYLNPKGFPIGIQLPQKDLFRRSIQSETIELAKDDILLVYTDGITEAMNPDRVLFGEERLLQTMRKHGHLEVNEFVENLKNHIYSFTEGNQQYDDISLVAIKEESTREEDELRRAKEAHRLISEGMSIREAFTSVNLTTYAYYNKYKKIFEQGGLDSVEINEDVSVEAKHLSIEEKTKIIDIIANYPEYGPARISDALNTEKYGLTKISENRIYDELVRSRLNTRQLREAYVNKSKRSNRRPKPPGTPMMTLDGKIIVDRKSEPAVSEEKQPRTSPSARETKPEAPVEKEQDVAAQVNESATGPQPSESLQETKDKEKEISKTAADAHSSRKGPLMEADALIDTPIDEVLSKDNGTEGTLEDMALEDDVDDPERVANPDAMAVESEPSFDELISEPVMYDRDLEESEATLSGDAEAVESSFMADISFEQFFDDGNDLSEETFDDEDDSSGLVEEPAVEPQSPVGETVPDEKPVLAPVLSSAAGEISGDSREHPADSQTVSTEKPSAKNRSSRGRNATKDEKVSFADVLQAIDQEIVYVKDTPKKAGAKSKGKTNGKRPSPQAPQQDNLVAAGSLNENAGKAVDGRGVKLSDREKILVRGIKFYKNKDYEKAIREFKRVIETYPDYKEAHNILGNAYFRNQMFDEAAEAYTTVKELDPADISAYENMGVIYANRGEMKRAVGEWKRVLDLAPDRTDIAGKIKKALRMV